MWSVGGGRRIRARSVLPAPASTDRLPGQVLTDLEEREVLQEVRSAGEGVGDQLAQAGEHGGDLDTIRQHPLLREVRQGRLYPGEAGAGRGERSWRPGGAAGARVLLQLLRRGQVERHGSEERGQVLLSERAQRGL